MQFKVPKFLEREATIAFGLTFRKLAVLGGLGLILFILYYTVPRFIFVFALIMFSVGFSVAAFIKINHQSIPEIFMHSFGFFLFNKTFIWEKQNPSTAIKLVSRKDIRKDAAEEQKEASLKAFPKSKLGRIRSEIEMGSKSID